MIPPRAARWILPVVAFILAGTASPAAPDAPSPAACATLVRDHPEDLESYRCYWRAARRGEWDRATRALESLLAIDEANNGAWLYMAAVAKDRWERRAETLCRRAADGFAAAGDAAGEAHARILLVDLLDSKNRGDESAAELEALRSAVERAHDPVLRGWLRILEARLARSRRDYAEAMHLLAQAEQTAFPDGPAELRSWVLAERGFIHWQTGSIEESLDEYTRGADLLRRTGDLFAEAEARVKIGYLHRRLLLDEVITEEAHLELLEEALGMAVRSGNPVAELKARLQLGDALEGPRAINELRRSEAITRRIGAWSLLPWTQRTLATGIFRHGTAPDQRGEALVWIDEAIAGSRSAGDLDGVAFGLIDRADMFDREGEREAWIEAWNEALEAVERCRDLLPDGTVGRRVFSRTWSWAYIRFARQLAAGAASSPDPRGDIDLSFRVTERMRSRLKLDAFDTARALPSPVGDPADHDRRDEILASIASLQRSLANPALDPIDRRAHLVELERLELEEAALRERIAREDPTFAALRAPEIPNLDQVQDRLAPDQALLCYQLGPGRKPSDPGAIGGSWVLLVTREQARVFSLAGRKEINLWARVAAGLCRRYDDSLAPVAAQLFDALLGEPLAAADESVRQLIIVPDGDLHRLPFAALRANVDESPIGAHYEITRAPSAAAWLSRAAPPVEDSATGDRSDVLALADPDLSGLTVAGQTRAARPWVEGLRLGSLPRAQVESRRLVARLGGQVIKGPEASETFLKTTDLGKYGILHFAAHAVVDFDHPERSAVMLAPGSAREDGFLQMREIVELDLHGKVVVLSACRGASGEILRGEGVLGLARAFLLAGARSVIASLWPLRDDEAELLVDEFSRQLADGRSLTAALTAARTARIDAGAPPAAWAGLVIIGDGDFAPVRGGPSTLERLPFWLLPVLGFILLVAVIGALAFRRLRV